MVRYFLSFIMIMPVSVWAIDCVKTISDTEAHYCNNITIMRLDAVMNEVYHHGIDNSDKRLLKQQQLSWSKGRDDCRNNASCLEKKYVSRIQDILSNKDSYVFADRVKDFEFLSIASGREETSYGAILCEGPFRISIFHKGKGKPFQHLKIMKPTVEFDKGLFKKYAVNKPNDIIKISLNDINFDGFDDLSLSVRQPSAYAHEDIYFFIYNPEKKEFYENKRFTALAQSGLYYPEINRRNETLTTFLRSGCCWTQFNTWKIEKNEPVLIAEETNDSQNGEDIITTTKVLVSGKWKTTVTKKKI